MTARSIRRLLRGGVILGITAGVALATALPALAHVTTDPATAAQGGVAKVAFRVPDESDTAGTVKVEVHLPTDHPITSVQTTPIPGWTVTVAKIPLNPPVVDDGRTITTTIGSITWTANPGNRIGPDQFLDFDVAMGPLPKGVDHLTFPTLQTYDSGEVVSWIETSAPGAPEPDHPAPTVTLTAATGDAPLTAGAGGPAATPAAPTDTSDGTARWLAIAGIVIGAVGIGFAGGSYRRGRRTAANPEPTPAGLREPVPTDRD